MRMVGEVFFYGCIVLGGLFSIYLGCKLQKKLSHRKLLQKGLYISFCFYLFMVLRYTLLFRIPTPQPQIEASLFWSYKAWLVNGDTDMGKEIALNILLTVPLGYYLPLVSNFFTKKRVLLLACLLSICIEVLQYYGRIGLFELDDIMHNTLGAALGYLGYYILLRPQVEEVAYRKEFT